MSRKLCRNCGQEKDLAEFHVHTKKPDGRQAYCKPCRGAHAKRYWQTPEGRRVLRRRNLKRNFGITPEQYQLLLDGQGGVCAVCKGQSPDGKRLAVDHDHVTGQVRGLLCSRCNTALGSLNDSHALLVQAARYLTRPPAREILAALDDSSYGELR